MRNKKKLLLAKKVAEQTGMQELLHDMLQGVNLPSTLKTQLFKEIVRLCATAYTVAEMEAFVAFNESPIGKSINKKQPALLRRISAMSTRLTKKVLRSDRALVKLLNSPDFIDMLAVPQ